MTIKAITFDAYGTLLNIEGMHSKAAEEILKLTGFEADSAQFHTVWDRFADQLMVQKSFATIWSIFDQALTDAFQHFGFRGKRVPGDLELWRNMLKNCSPYSTAREVVARAGRDYKTALISNADNEELDLGLERAGLQFDLVLSSEDARSYKPNADIFQKAAFALGCQPQEIMHVGDSFIADVLGAKAFGASSVWINRKGREIPLRMVRPNHLIGELEEMLPLFENWKNQGEIA